MEIHQLLALYGHLIDSRQWSRLGEVFTEDIVFDGSDVGWPPINSLSELVTFCTAPGAVHPLARHATNIVVLPGGSPRSLSSTSKNVSIAPDRVTSSVYED